MSASAPNLEEMYWAERLAILRTTDSAPTRDQLAESAMQGLLATTCRGGWTESDKELARQSYAIADAMINRRDTDARGVAKS